MNIDIVSPDIFERPGGIARLTHSLMAACEATGAKVQAHALLDSHDTRQVKAYRGNRKALSLAVLQKGLAGHLLIFTHVNLSVLGMATKLRSPYIVLCHGIEVWPKLPRMRNLALRMASETWAVSEDTKAQLQKVQGLPEKQVRVIKNALPRGFSLPKLPEKRGDYFLTVTRLHPDKKDKGVDLCIEALRPDEHLVVIGDGEDRSRLERLAKGKNVTFLGRVSDAELNHYYRQARAFVLPSLGEGFGLVYLEAMSHGLPCVAAHAGGAPEVVKDGETGVVIPPRDRRALRLAMDRCFSDEGESMGQNGRKRLQEHFTYERYENDVKEALKRFQKA